MLADLHQWAFLHWGYRLAVRVLDCHGLSDWEPWQ